MMRLNGIAAAAACALLLACPAAAQVIGSGHAIGNGTASPAAPTDTQLLQIMRQSGSGLSFSGSTAALATVDATPTNGNCVQFDSSGGLVAAGGACTVGGGGGTVGAGLAHQLAFYPSSGTAIAGLNSPGYIAQAYGVKCDGSTNDQSALQALINQLIGTAGSPGTGGTIVLPAGTCVLGTTGLVENLSTFTTGFFKPYVNFQGQGQAATVLTYTGSGNALLVQGSADDVAFFSTSGLSFSGVGAIVSVSIGINMSDVAYFNISRTVSSGFADGIVGANIEQGSFTDSNFENNTNGAVFLGAATPALTESNNLSFFNTCVCNNGTSGLTVQQFNGLLFFGGSIQDNGFTGGSSGYGALLGDQGGCAFTTATFEGTDFEGNAGIADLWISTTSCQNSINLVGDGFIRQSGTHFTPNNIFVQGTAPVTLKLSGTWFNFLSGVYTPSASRPNINVSADPNAKIFDDGTNFFASPIEGPLYPAAQLGGNQWVSYTPGLSCGSGSLGGGSASGRYTMSGGAMTVSVTMVVSSLGSCGGSLLASLPPGVANVGAITPAVGLDESSGLPLGAFTAGNSLEIVTPVAAHTYGATASFQPN